MKQFFNDDVDEVNKQKRTINREKNWKEVRENPAKGLRKHQQKDNKQFENEFNSKKQQSLTKSSS